MKKPLHITILLCSLLLIIPIAMSSFPNMGFAEANNAGWEEIGKGSASGQGISNNNNSSWFSDIASAPDGSLYAVWQDEHEDEQGITTEIEIYVRRWNGSQWEEVGAGSASGGGISNNSGFSVYPDIAVASDGTPYVAWGDSDADEGDDEIFVRHWNGSVWEEAGEGSASGGGVSDNRGNSQGPAIAAAPDGKIYVAWNEFDNNVHEIYVRRWNGTRWEEVGSGSASGGGVSNNGHTSLDPEIAVAPDGTPYVTWQDNRDGKYKIYVRRWNGRKWEEVGPGSASGDGISSADGSDWTPDVSVAPDNAPYVVWDGHDGAAGGIYARRWNGSSWEEVGSGSASGDGISDTSEPAFTPSVAIGGDGKTYIAWIDRSSGEDEVYVRSWNGSTWDEVGNGSASDGGISNTGGRSYHPTLAFAANDTPVVTWDEYADDTLQVYARQFQSEETTFSISGKVALKDGTPLEGVRVSTLFAYVDITDSSGQYTITNLPEGEYDVIAGLSGYEFATNTVAVPPDQTGVDFAAKLDDHDYDSGFRPIPHGYSFPNGPLPNDCSAYGWSCYSDPPARWDFTLLDLQKMFGNERVCILEDPPPGEPCSRVYRVALRWLEQVNEKTNGGHCSGMSASSLRFYEDKNRLPSDVLSAHDLDLRNVRREIAFYQIEAFAEPFRSFKAEEMESATPKDTLAKIKRAFSEREHIVLVMKSRPESFWSLPSGHAVVPYALDDAGNGLWKVLVYDNNRPMIGPVIEIDENNNTWNYKGLWNGDASTGSLIVVPLDIFSGPQRPPKFWGVLGIQNQSVEMAGSAEIWLTGNGHLLITDSEGRKLGFEGEKFVNQMPEAIVHTIFGGASASEPTYEIPLDETYEIVIDGSAANSSELGSLTQFGLGYAAAVDNIPLNESTGDKSVFTNDGTAIHYTATNDGERDLILISDQANSAQQFEIVNADVGKGETVAIKGDREAKRLTFDNSGADGGRYDFRFVLVDASKALNFEHEDIDIRQGATHYMDYSDWDGTGPVELEIDNGSNGTIDEVLELENFYREPSVYLPITASYR